MLRQNHSMMIQEGGLRLNGLGGLLSPGALYLRHNFLTRLVITKHRDTKAADIPDD